MTDGFTMKKIILTAAVLFACGPLFADNFLFSPGDVVLYPGAAMKLYGYTFEKPSGMKIDGSGGAYYSAGAAVDVFFSDWAALTAGLYQDKATETYKVYSSGHFDVKANFSFLTIPVGMRFYFWDFHFLGIGAYYGKMQNKEFRQSSDFGTYSDKTHSRDDYGVWFQFGYAAKITERINSLFYVGGKRGLVSVYSNDASVVTGLKLYELSAGFAVGFRI
jgi:hypothetical protein